MGIFRILVSIIGGDAAMMSRLIYGLQIITSGILLVLAIGIVASLYRTFREIRH